MSTLPSERFLLRNLSLPARLVVTVFLIAVGLGYLAALVQLRVQHASAGEMMPSEADTIAAFNGREGMSTLERVLEAPVSEPFNGSGQMRAALTDPSHTGGWNQDINKLAKAAIKKKEEQLKHEATEAEITQLWDEAEQRVRTLREGERQVFLDWIRSSYTDKDKARQAYEKNKYFPSEQTAATLHLNEDDEDKRLITPKFVVDKDEKDPRVNAILIRNLISQRCARCHAETVTDPAGAYPLEKYEQVAVYLPREHSGGMSLPKLAQSTHVHLLSFSMLWALTGLVFACTSYWVWVRAIFGPWTLVAQIADIGCWWLAWKYPQAAVAIRYTGALVGLGVAVQILGTLFDLFGWTGKLVLALVLGIGIVGLGVFYGEVVQSRFQKEHDGEVKPAFELPRILGQSSNSDLLWEDRNSWPRGRPGPGGRC